ncbi:hypothetical protein AC579_10188 [Pseudocercospora musae]|uniref:Uncharacterized protein n=1 Tax=Pseudocercospora musae TaxID=113226 RepID=A0A139I2V7_9PEZI|nr:hypothetical protein AC579_10188 [Pseudocercospora musae]
MKANTIILAFLTAVAYSAPVQDNKHEQDSADLLPPPNANLRKPEENYGFETLTERDVEYFLIKASDLHFETGRPTIISARDPANNKFISYETLQGNSVPCSRSGATFYNCRPGAQANPYTRPCSAAEQCRGGK